jgi:hypothetical protein
LRFSSRLICAALLLAVLPCLGQSTSPDEASTESNVYTNFFFRFRLTYSPSWTPRAQLSQDEIRLAGSVPFAARGPQAAGKGFHNLLMLSRFMPGIGEGRGARATVLVIAEDISSDAEAVTLETCVDRFAERQKEAEFTPTGPPQEEKLGGRAFLRQDFRGKSPLGTPLYQGAFFILARGHALGFILTAPTEAMLESMVGTVRKVKFF